MSFFGILEFLVNFLRNSRIYLRNSRFILRNSRNPCVIAREQSDRSNLVQNSVIAKISVIASEAKQSLGILEFTLGILEFFKIRHCEALKKPKQSHLLSLERDCFVVRFTHSSQ